MLFITIKLPSFFAEDCKFCNGSNYCYKMKFLLFAIHLLSTANWRVKIQHGILKSTAVNLISRIKNLLKLFESFRNDLFSNVANKHLVLKKGAKPLRTSLPDSFGLISLSQATLQTVHLPSLNVSIDEGFCPKGFSTITIRIFIPKGI